MSDTKMHFSFGDPEPVLNNRMTDYLGIFTDLGGKYWVPPVSLNGLAQTMKANPHHNSIIHFKKNMILKWFNPSKILSYPTMKQLALDFEAFGMLYAQVFTNAFGTPVRLGHLPALAMRRGKKPGVFFQLLSDGTEIEFKPGEVIQINEYDVMQSIYGVPEYIGGIQSVLLSEDAGLFRRKYFKNGVHMGYIFLTTDTGLDEEELDYISEQVSQSKGPGNFRSMHLNIESSKAKEPVQIIPVGDIGTKDEFERIKNITRGEILSMHRMYAGLSGVIPENNSGFGDMEKLMHVYHELEVGAMQQPFLELNEALGRRVVEFREPKWNNQNVS